MTDRLVDAVGEGDSGRALGFWRLPGGFEAVLARWSRAGAVAYVEAEYFGGAGEQSAAVWEGGELAWGPVHVPEGREFSADGGPISQALRRLGVVAREGQDEFATLGLGRHRDNERWIRAGGGR
ncbi:hypothetical protein [Streptomyces liangshanensis]|nr:hypothetical protein [Streptomyces liangshanensis]